MNTNNRIALAGAAGAIALVIALASPSIALAENPSGVAESQLSGPPPSPAYVWMTGHWNSEGGQWAWAAAHWELPPTRSAIWVSGHWASEAGRWVWVNGAWNASESSQSPATPPQPPVPGDSPAVQSMPMPSTPAPLFSGAYGPDGLVRAIDQPPVTTDYGPIDYSTAGPGYYWAGDPYWSADSWLWGYPGAYFGLGWGPAYYGGYYYGRGGRGGRGYGGHAWAPGRTGYPAHSGGSYGGHAGNQAGGGGNRQR